MSFSKRNSYFGRQFFFNLLVCALVIALVAPLCLSFYHAFAVHQQENYQNSLQVLFNDVNANLSVMHDLIRNTEINDGLQRVSNIRGKSKISDTYPLMKAQDYVAILAQSNPYIADCVVAFAQNDILLTAKSVYYDLEEFSLFYQLTDAQLPQWLDKLRQYQAVVEYLPVSGYKYWERAYEDGLAYTKELAFCYAVPFRSLWTSGEFFLLIREDTLLDKLPENFLSFSEIVLQNAAGETIYCYQGEKYQDEADTVFVSMESGDGLLRLRARLDNTAITAMIASTRWLIVVYLALALLVVLALAAFFTMRQFKPMSKVFEQLRACGYSIPRDSEQVSFVVQAIGDMQLKHRDVTRTLSSYRDQLRDTQLERLLSSPYTPGMQLPDQLPACYRVGYAYILPEEGERDYDLLGTLVTRVLRHSMPENTIVHRMENDVFALIVPIEVPLDTLRDVFAQVNSELPQPLCVALSEGVESPSGMHAAFETARMVSMGQNAGELFRVASENTLEPGISIQAGMRVYQEIITGDAPRAAALITEMMRKPSPPFHSVAECYEYIRLNIRFALRDAQFTEECAPPPCAPSVPPEKLLSLLLESTEQVCQMEKDAVGRKNAEREGEILAWVEANLHEWTLNAEMVSRRFGISERKVHQIARQAGESSFSSYLQQRRMRLITRLLEETDLPVSDIGAHAGYNTPSTFFKAFKRMYGVTPGEYRLQHRGGEETGEAQQVPFPQ